VAKLLLDHQATHHPDPTVLLNRPNSQGNTPLHLAVINRHGSCVRFLLDRGAVPTVLNHKGQTPAALAESLGDAKLQLTFSPEARPLLQQLEAERRRTQEATAEIASLRLTQAELQGQLVEQRVQHEQSQRELADLRAALATTTQLNRDMRTCADQLEERLDQLTTQLAALSTAKAALEHQVATLLDQLASVSTAPSAATTTISGSDAHATAPVISSVTAPVISSVASPVTSPAAAAPPLMMQKLCELQQGLLQFSTLIAQVNQQFLATTTASLGP
jgi:hypothetical protein